LYGVIASQPYRAVLWPCLLKEIPLQIELLMPGLIELGGTRSAEFLKISTPGTVPAIDDNGFTLYESCAILVYLAEKYGWTDLYPKDLQSRARIHQYLHWHHRNTREITVKLIAPFIRPDLKLPFGPNEKKYAERIVGMLENNFFSKSKFIVGDHVTIADFVCFEELVQCDKEYCDTFDFSAFPNVVRWMNDMKKIPKYSESHQGLSKVTEYFKAAMAKSAHQAKL